MHILLAPDSFKESLSAKQVAEALEKGFKESLPEATFDLLPIGDGGRRNHGYLGRCVSLKKRAGLRHGTLWKSSPNALLPERADGFF